MAEISEEEKRKQKELDRKKSLAILKASNEMLEQAKLTCLERGDVDEGVIKQIDGAKEENLMLAMSRHGASPDEVENAQYHGASIKEIKAYETRLRKRGITDEMVHQKNIRIGVASGTKENDDSEKFTNNRRTEIGVGKIDDNTIIRDTDEIITTSVNEESSDKEEKPKVRRSRKKIAQKEKPSEENKVDKKLDGKIEISVTPDKTIEIKNEEPVKAEVTNKRSNSDEDDYSIEDFNLSDVPDYVQYDIIPLPSKGQCYKHKKSRIPVAYLTASDENLIASPNMYRDGKLLDVILKRKILDTDFKVDELCSGDRDAIILWLRATSYGEDFPIITTNPNNGKQYNVSVNLSEFKYYDFNLVSNDDAEFEFTASNGDKIGFKFLSRADEDSLRTKLLKDETEANRFNALKSISNVRDAMERLEIEGEDKIHVSEDIEELLEIVGGDMPDIGNDVYTTIITDQMLAHTVSINGNHDKEYIKNYIENMRTKDAKMYRDYFTLNRPGVDFNIDVTIPESDGGGSFSTFLRLDDTVFLNF